MSPSVLAAHDVVISFFESWVTPSYPLPVEAFQIDKFFERSLMPLTSAFESDELGL